MEFVDLKQQYKKYKKEIDKEILNVITSAQFINGPALQKFESELVDYLGGNINAIGCSSGTDAILIALMALGVKPGDEIIVPDFTFIATGEVVAFLGAVPVFCDVDPVTYNIDPLKIDKLITSKTAGIIPVSIFGQTADFDLINEIAEKYALWVVEDGAQSFGATYKGRKSCTQTKASTTSFFPAKPLGCYGDGGAIFTNDDDLAEKMRVILNHGQTKRYHHSTIGINGRMDSLQAAILSVKLSHFDNEIHMRQEIAQKYTAALSGQYHTPVILNENTSTWAQYTLQHDSRDRIREILQENNIPTAVHYPVPLHKQKAFSYITNHVNNPVTESLSEKVFSLPMHPFLTDKEIDEIISVLLEAVV